MVNRRHFLRAFAAATLGMTLPRKSSATTSALDRRIREAINNAVKYLTDHQSSDGAWRSEIYGPFKDGPSLTSLIAATLAPLKNIPKANSAYRDSARYLAALVSPAGQLESIAHSLTYPAYTAAGTVLALTGHSAFQKEQQAWLSYLRTLQLADELGWHPSDHAYGGWGYAATNLQPVNGAPATPLAVPNLSATVFALSALHAAGVSPVDPAIRRARVFVERCQNFCDDLASAEERFDDGGFYFLLEDPQRNKAGEVGLDGAGRQRFASYGSATADGLRALAYCGCDENHPRRRVAQSWLERNFSAEQHPGAYQPNREHLRPTLFYYYAASLSRAFRLTDRLRHRAPKLASSILSRQLTNGSWVNTAVDVREDDPLVATPLAIQALHNCLAI